jgi:uncharacterized protein HemX
LTADSHPSTFRATTRKTYLAVRQELQRPLPLGRAVIAVLGWLIVIWFAWSASAQRDELERNEVARVELAGELERQRQASGQLADLQAKIGTAEAELARLNASVAQAQTQVGAGKKSSSRRGRDR